MVLGGRPMNAAGPLLVVTDHGLGRVDGDSVELLDLAHLDVSALVRDAGSLAPARTASVRDRVPLAGLRLRCPLSAPLGIWGIGLNYRAKAALTGRPIPEHPILFLKPAAALAGPGTTIPIPAVPSAELDHEAEVAVVVGRRLCAASPAEAWGAVAGITTANDFTARDVMRRTGTPTLAKSFDGFSPLGPSVLDAAGLAPDFDLAVRASVNGALVQDGRTGDLILGVAELLAAISAYSTLEPGDVVLTGTPPGTGQDRGSFLLPGDRVTVEVDGLLPLDNWLGERAP
jgi:2-keto-4-pentenoate hydratase/2-oxohepta-3-ene-1,7-dioic acid hydratase in catechol pathway